MKYIIAALLFLPSVLHADEYSATPLGNGKILIRTVTVKERIVEAADEATALKSEIAAREKIIEEARKQNEEATLKQTSATRIIESQNAEKEQLLHKLNAIKRQSDNK